MQAFDMTTGGGDMGFPADPVSSFPPIGLEGGMSASIPPPKMSTLDSIWAEIKNDSISAVGGIETAVENVYGGIKDITKTVYKDVSSGVGSVYEDVTTPIANAQKTYFTYAIFGVIVLFVGLYYVGKTGAVKVNAIV